MSEKDLTFMEDGDYKFRMRKNGKAYTVGGEYFPVKDKENIEVFLKENCREFKLAKLINKINKLEFEKGRCYTNINRIIEAGKEVNIDIKFYSGWVFPRSIKAMHHAWGVIKTKFGFQVLDPAFSKKELKLYETIDYDKENWREVLAKKILDFEKNKDNEEKMVLGKPPEGIIYFGCPDNKENAINTFNNLIDKFPNHPSYSGKGTSPVGRSELQKELKRQKNKKV